MQFMAGGETVVQQDGEGNRVGKIIKAHPGKNFEMLVTVAWLDTNQQKDYPMSRFKPIGSDTWVIE